MKTHISEAPTKLATTRLRAPEKIQVAALCYRRRQNGQKDILLITSRDTGRWIIPKGWPIKGLNAAGAAMQEAWEEAGVANGTVKPKPIGVFRYDKQRDNGAVTPCVTDVFALKVDELAENYPERSQRERQWVSPAKAAEMVQEPELKKLLRAF